VSPSFDAAIRRAAEYDQTTIVEFTRRALLAELRARGFDPSRATKETRR
jgi:hypothetical protein